MAVQVDTITIVFAALFVNVFMIILLLGYRSGLKKERSVNMFLKAKIFHMSAFIVSGISLMFQMPEWTQTVFLLVRNALFFSTIVCESLAYLILLNECSKSLKSAYISLLIIFISAFSLVCLLEVSEDFRIITFSIMAATIILYTAVLCFIRKRNTFLLKTVGVLYLLIMVALVFRALVAGNAFGSDDAVKLQGQSWLAFSVLVLMILGNNGFFMLAKEQTDEKLLALANIDGLTGVLNRRAFFEQAGRSLRYFSRKKRPVSFLMIDIDCFKKVNDTYGHFVGDIAIKTVAGEVQNQLRGYDYLGRFGGDEFVVMLPGTDEKDSGIVAERLRNMIESKVIYDERVKLQITVSIGLATLIPQNTTTIEMLYKLGDWALHEAKRAGGNCTIRAGGINEKGDANGENSKSKVEWVGKVDWELQKFHGNELSTFRGTTYNSYLIREEKNVLVDTVWKPYAGDFVENLSKIIDLSKIDYIIANHGEIDHSGSLPALLQKIPNVPIYCTGNGVDSIRGQYHQDWNFHTVKTGDRLPIGNGKELVFVEMTMLHWPDSMATYLTKDNILFSNDAFGQHLAGEELWADLADQCALYEEAIKYYANILAPFSPILRNKLKEIAAMNIPINMIAPSHGMIWRKDPAQILNKYAAWASDYQENQITVLYDTMWQGTEELAHRIAWGIQAADPAVRVRVHNLSKTDKNDVVTDVFKSKTVAIGSPTVNNGILSAVAAMLSMIKEMKFKNKKAAVFGAYGWSGEATRILKQGMTDAGFAVMDDGLRYKWYPDEIGKTAAFEYGRKLAAI